MKRIFKENFGKFYELKDSTGLLYGETRQNWLNQWKVHIVTNIHVVKLGMWLYNFIPTTISTLLFTCHPSPTTKKYNMNEHEEMGNRNKRHACSKAIPKHWNDRFNYKMSQYVTNNTKCFWILQSTLNILSKYWHHNK